MRLPYRWPAAEPDRLLADAYVPEDAEDLFDLGVGRRATAAMEQYFERAPQSEEEIRASVSGTMDAAWETAVAIIFCKAAF